jgi:hypothetical protein
MNIILRGFIVGWSILVAAIIINALANKITLLTWYTYLTKIPGQVSAIDYVFLYVIYPLLLGLVGVTVTIALSKY